MQPALAFEEAYPGKVYIKSDCIEAINNHIELLQPPEAFITGKPQTDEVSGVFHRLKYRKINDKNGEMLNGKIVALLFLSVRFFL